MTLLTHLELECPANIFKLNYSNTPSEIQIKIMALALFLIDTGATCSIIKCDTFTEIEKNSTISCNAS